MLDPNELRHLQQGHQEQMRSPETVKRLVTDAVQARLDAFAHTRGYDGILSACTYVNSTHPEFAKEGRQAIQARDKTWAKCYEIMNAVATGARPLPLPEQVIAELPPLYWLP